MSGWGADPSLDGLNLPDEDFDYESYVAAEFGGKPKTSRKEKLWRLAGVIVLVMLAWIILRGAFL